MAPLIGPTSPTCFTSKSWTILLHCIHSNRKFLRPIKSCESCNRDLAGSVTMVRFSIYRSILLWAVSYTPQMFDDETLDIALLNVCLKNYVLRCFVVKELTMVMQHSIHDTLYQVLQYSCFEIYDKSIFFSYERLFSWLWQCVDRIICLPSELVILLFVYHHLLKPSPRHTDSLLMLLDAEYFITLSEGIQVGQASSFFLFLCVFPQNESVTQHLP